MVPECECVGQGDESARFAGSGQGQMIGRLSHEPETTSPSCN
jgi:hypothetical protein